MRIRKVAIWRLNLAFRYPFKHSLATHGGSENLVIGVTTAEGIVGYGEGIPRAFVTGETMAASLEALTERLAPRVLSHPLPSPPQLFQSLEALLPTPEREAAPAACCALETALLDAAARTQNQPLANLLGPRRRDTVVYSAVLPMASQTLLSRFLAIVKGQSMRFLKVKVGGEDDLAVLDAVRREMGREVDLRIDANGAWTAEEALDFLREAAPYHLSAVEQPVPRGDVEGMAAVSAGSRVPVIADESLVTEADAERLIAAGACQIFNLRLSKHGGFLPTLRLRRLAEDAGLRYQLGCHVGESSLLAAAGRQFALTCPELAFAEGSFAPYLLTQDVMDQPVTFDREGVARPLPGPGLGAAPRENLLHDLASYQTVVT